MSLALTPPVAAAAAVVLHAEGVSLLQVRALQHKLPSETTDKPCLGSHRSRPLVPSFSEGRGRRHPLVPRGRVGIPSAHCAQRKTAGHCGLESPRVSGGGPAASLWPSDSGTARSEGQGINARRRHSWQLLTGKVTVDELAEAGIPTEACAAITVKLDEVRASVRRCRPRSDPEGEKQRAPFPPRMHAGFH